MGLLLTFIMFFDMLGALFFIPACVVCLSRNLSKARASQRRADSRSCRSARCPRLRSSAARRTSVFRRGFQRRSARGKKDAGGGANANIGTRDGYTLLMEAVKIPQAESRLAIVKMLLDAGVNLRAHDAEGNSALHLAAICGFDDTARMLIKYGAEVNDGATIKNQPLGKALQHGNIKTFECLIQKAPG